MSQRELSRLYIDLLTYEERRPLEKMATPQTAVAQLKGRMDEARQWLNMHFQGPENVRDVAAKNLDAMARTVAQWTTHP
jgi:hypothetical protein